MGGISFSGAAGMQRRPLTSNSRSMGMTVGPADQTHQFNYFSAKTGANGMDYDEEDVEQLEREIENVMRHSNLGHSSGLIGYGNGSAIVDD